MYAWDFKSDPFFLTSSSCQLRCVSQAGAGHSSCWTPGTEHSTTLSCPHPTGLPWLSAHGRFPASLSWPTAAASRAATTHTPWFYFFFFFNLCILITCPPFQKAGCFEITMFPQVMLLSIPLDSSINRKLLVSRRKLSWFLYSLNLFSMKPLANLPFIFQGYKTKPNAIRQRSAYIFNNEQGLGNLVKSFIRATLKFLTK